MRSLATEGGTNLALSGGGFRATLFHVGALWRLNELGVLGTLRRVTSVSGGSIAAAFLGLVWSKLDFDDGVVRNFEQEFIEPLRRFCGKTIDSWAIAEALLTPWWWHRAGNALERAYRRGLYGSATLKSLPDEPEFLILSTNLLNAAHFRFSKNEAGDYLAGTIRNPSFLLSEAVAASSAFPPILSPFALRIDPTEFERPYVVSDTGPWHLRGTVYLSDGGVIDNLGLEPVFTQPGTLLVSDAGAPGKFQREIFPLWIVLSKRAFDIAIYQAIPQRRRRLINSLVGGKSGTYWSIRSPLTDVPGRLNCHESITRQLAAMRTRLNSFSEEEQCNLINWGYAVCDAYMRKHVITDGVASLKWPFPNYALEGEGRWLP